MDKSLPKAKILYGESDTDLLAAQAARFQKAGYAVQQAVGRKGVEEAVRRETFDLVILGHSLSKDDRHHLPYIVKKTNEAARVLVLHTSKHHPEVDVSMDAPHDIEAILEKISVLLPRQAAAAVPR